MGSDLMESLLSRDMLSDILTELKKMNLHLQAMTGEEFQNDY
jgi:hypothetical protein